MAYVPFPQALPSSGDLSKVRGVAGYLALALVAMAVSVPAAIATFGAVPEAPVMVSDAR